MLDSGKIVAVKKLVCMPGITDIQFENEVNLLMMLNHQNIVRFLGYCSETRQVCMKHDGKYVLMDKQEKLLCLEYIPNGSLERCISGAKLSPSLSLSCQKGSKCIMWSSIFF